MNFYFLTSVLLMGLSISFTVNAKSVERPSEDDSFYLESGNIFHINSRLEVREVPGIEKVGDLVEFKGKIIARQANGDVFLLNERGNTGSGDWIKLTSNAEKIVTDGRDLFALVSSKPLFRDKRKDVMIFNGSPGDLVWTYTSVPVACGTNSICMSTPVPTLAGRQVAFRKIPVKNPSTLTVEDGQAVVVTDSGDKVILSE